MLLSQHKHSGNPAPLLNTGTAQGQSNTSVLTCALPTDRDADELECACTAPPKPLCCDDPSKPCNVQASVSAHASAHAQVGLVLVTWPHAFQRA